MTIARSTSPTSSFKLLVSSFSGCEIFIGQLCSSISCLTAGGVKTFFLPAGLSGLQMTTVGIKPAFTMCSRTAAEI